MKYIERILSEELKASAKEYPIVVILGPRQSGKTTLAKNIFSEKKYVSLENLDNRDFAKNDPNGFIKTYESGAIIDEVQRVPSLLSYLQTEVDENPITGRFILTGSNQYMLQEKVTQSLAGRVALLKLLPLSLEELHQAGMSFTLDQIIFEGCYPKIHAQKVRVKSWYDNYIETYVDKDVRLIKNIENLSLFNLFLKMLANRAGQLVNLASIGNDCGVSQNTIKSWISILESSYIIKLLYPYYKNFNKRLVKAPKIYFLDTGLLCRLLGIKESSELQAHPFRGGIFESFIFSEFEKKFTNRGEKSSLYFWRDKNGHEIDFLIDGADVKLIEVKSARTINSDYFKNIKYYQKQSKGREKSFLIYSGEEKQYRENITVLPWSEVGEITDDM